MQRAMLSAAEERARQKLPKARRDEPLEVLTYADIC